MMKKIFITPLVLAMMLFIASIAHAAITDCKSGYKFNPRSGVGCQQENCYDITSAHYSYEGYCICGSSGSINEKPTDPNKACRYGNDYTTCPGCVYACVHADEDCPNQNTNTPPAAEPPAPAPTIVQPAPTVPPAPVVEPVVLDPALLGEAPPTPVLNTTGMDTIPQPTAAPAAGPTCEKFCAKLMRGGTFDEVLVAIGTYPNCECTVDNKDKDNRLTQTITQNGDIRTTYTYDPATGQLIKKDTISIMAEKERIRELLGFKYDEEQIDQLLSDEVINEWFATKMSNIETNASAWTPAFWWQHMVALWDHGYGNSADFVDTYNFGRCGDSMEWLERNLAGQLKLDDKRSEAMLSITGEKYGNIINHTALIIRPAGYSNIAWGEVIKELTTMTQRGGLTQLDINNLDPQLLDAKVLDPYFKKTTTVREFIKGWSVIKIS